MSLDLATIPTERLALLDQATLFHGPHGGGTGGPDCKHCARELLHEVVTGKHADRTPPGLSIIVDMLPGMNDGPWRDDAHRTAVMRPYLTKILVLDPARDTDRVYALLDYICRDALSAFLDAVGEGAHAQALRALAPIKDEATAQAALDLARALDLDLARALALDLDLDLALTPEQRAEAWERHCRRVLDIVCAI